jgi:hypothetical protein
VCGGVLCVERVFIVFLSFSYKGFCAPDSGSSSSMMSQKRPPTEDCFSSIGPKMLFTSKNRRRRKDDDDDHDAEHPATAWCTYCRQAGVDLAPCQCYTASGGTSGGTNLCADCDDVGDDMMLYCDACEGRLCSRGSCDYRTCHGCHDVTYCHSCIVTTAEQQLAVTSCFYCSAMYCGDCGSSSNDDDDDSNSSSSSNSAQLVTACTTCKKTACKACQVKFSPPCDVCGAAVCNDCVADNPQVVDDSRRSCQSCAGSCMVADVVAQENTSMIRTPCSKNCTADHEDQRS